MPKTYLVQREDDGVAAYVIDGDNVQPLRHLVHHSPDGFEFGYGGSGPADLARSIVGDLLDTDNPDPVLYQHFKWHWVADLDDGRSFHIIHEPRIRELLGEAT